MLLCDFIGTYGYGVCGNVLISIYGFCEELKQGEVISSEWYDDIKGRTIKYWQIIEGVVPEIFIILSYC